MKSKSFNEICYQVIDSLEGIPDTKENRAKVCVALASVLFVSGSKGDKYAKANGAMAALVKAIQRAKPQVKEKLPLMFHVSSAGDVVHTVRFKDGIDAYRATCGELINASETTGDVRDESIQITCAKCLAEYTERFTWTVQFTVHPTWVQDGFNLDDDCAADMLGRALPWAYADELGAKVLIAPDADEIAMEQGYKNAEHMRSDQC